MTTSCTISMTKILREMAIFWTLQLDDLRSYRVLDAISRQDVPPSQPEFHALSP